MSGEFGYPEKCKDCDSLTLSREKRPLTVKPYISIAGSFRLMLIGQDPTIRKRPEDVRVVLMLDKGNGQLSRWLHNLFGKGLENATIYATNIVKCGFSKPPSDIEPSGKAFLEPFAQVCKKYLTTEITRFRPDLVMTFGESTHILFRSMFDHPEVINEKMKDAFTGSLVRAAVGGFKFEYSPCLHIQTYRVAQTYSNRVQKFEKSIREKMTS